MNKIEFMRLWDCYFGLLTPTQQEITNLYFNLDLTVSEIAQEKGISRQAVSECLSGCKKQLAEYEEKLHVFKLNTEYSLSVSFMITEAEKWADDFAAAHPQFGGEIACLKKILSNDFSKEVAQALAEGGEGNQANSVKEGL